MILIVDAGSTKTSWCMADGDRSDVMRSSGINAATMSRDRMADIVMNELMPWLAGRHAEAVYYYGAGVVGDVQRKSVTEVLAPVMAAYVTVESDMLGAARSILGHDAGIACILGTGSNTCCYDGIKIVDNVPSLGYILGDEGSGASLGRRFAGDLFKRLLPSEAWAVWRERVGLDMAGVIDRVYRQPGANTFMGSLVPMIHDLMHINEIADMVEDEFERFFTRNVERYDTECRRLGFVGSIAIHFGEVLQRVATRHGYTIKAMSADPMEGLVRYHTRP